MKINLPAAPDILLPAEASEPLTDILLDLTQRTVGQGILLQDANKMNTANLPQGLYMLQLANDKGARPTVKVVKE